MSIFHEAIYVVGAFALCISLYFNLVQIKIIRYAKMQIGMQTKRVTRKTTLNSSKLFAMANQLETAVKGLATSNYWTQDHQQCPSLYRTKLRNELGQVRSLLHTLRNSQFDINTGDVSSSDCLNQTNDEIESQSLQLVSFHKALSEFARFHHCKMTMSLSERCIMAIPNSTLCKVLKELVVNAVVHNEAYTDIHVYGGICGKNLVVNVSDNGKGISEALLQAIWKKVENANTLHRRSADTYVFTDLPAAISTIKSFGGKVEVNTALNYGTNVRVFVPLLALENTTIEQNDDKTRYSAPETKKAAFSSKKLPREEHPSTRQTVLVVNFSNSQFLREAGAKILPNHELCHAESTDEVITALSRQNIKLVVCDIDVEYDKALELSSFMAASHKLRNIPVVLLAFAIPQDIRIKLLRAGVTHFLEKPVRIEEVMAISRACMDEVKAVENNVEEALATYTIEKSVLKANKAESDFAEKFENIIESYSPDQKFNRVLCASLLFMSEKTLQRRIRDHFDSNFRTYLLTHRMSKAHGMLLNGESVTNASLNVGIPSLSNFTRNFRQHYGYPPSKLSKRG